MGEHAVVYGQPCMATAVSQRLWVMGELAHGGEATIEAPQVKETKFVDAAVAKFFKMSGSRIAKKGVHLTIKSDFSHQVGFGSSSAVSVAAIKALSILFNIPLTDREIFDMAYQVTLDIQGVGSGFDIAAATYGGTLYFKKGGSEIVSLSKAPPLVIGYSGIKADTPTIVRKVSEKYKQYPQKVERIFTAIGKLVEQGREALENEDWETLGKLMNFNQDYLRDLGVSSQKLEDMILAAKQAGAWGAKLSGAGGGDCMIALHPDGVQGKLAIIKALQDAGGTAIDIETGAPGVRVELSDDQSELFVVVDKEDNIINYRSRGECHHNKSLIHRAIGVFIFNDTGKILLQKRSLGKDTSPGLWSTSVGGHVLKDESYEEAAKREMKEELGVDLPIHLATKFIYEYPYETEIETLFTAKGNGPFRQNTDEIERLEFVDRRDLPRNLLSGKIKLAPIALHELKVLGFL